MSVRRTDGPSWKIRVCLKNIYIPSWKIHVCSTNRWTLLENSCLFEEHIYTLLKNSCLFEEHIDPPGKFMSVRRTDGPSWKIHVCSTNRWTLLKNSCLFDEQMDLPEKFMSVRGTTGLSWKIIKRLLLEKKTDIFENCLGGCLLLPLCVKVKIK